MTKRILFTLIAAAGLAGCATLPPSSFAHRDPPIDPVHPASMTAFVLPSGDGAMNALLYLAAGEGPHPALLLLHGFPGNEQNLDLAQAARRAGWTVLTLHYRGSWGSPGAFSFDNAAADAATALAYLRDPANAARIGIDRDRIAVAGHSMGGFMAADAAASDPAVIGLFLIDAWNPAETGRGLSDPAALASWRAELAGDLPPLAGTSEGALTAELRDGHARFDLDARAAAFGRRPLYVIGAERGGGASAKAMLARARAGGNDRAEGDVWPTDHSFSDKRIALSALLVEWLGRVGARRD